MIRTKILIIGSSGLLGSALTPYLKNNNFEITTINKSNKNSDYILDVSNFNKTYYLLNKIKPKLILNLSSYTSVEACELNPNLAYLHNTTPVESLVNWIKDNKSCYLIQISTDQVYDGHGPHVENEIKLLNYYAMTKYFAEISAKEVNSGIFRTNFIGRSKDISNISLTDWIYQSCIKNASIKVLEDVLFTPLAIQTLCDLIKLIIKKKPTGLYNLGSNNGMSKADLDFFFAKKLKLNFSNMKRIKMKEATFFKARRPKDMRMDSSKFEKKFNLKLPNLKDEIIKVTEDYKVFN